MPGIKRLPLSDIHPNPNNPRTISKEDLKILKESIVNNPEMLEARPIIVNKEMMILAGNQRYRALKELNIPDVPVFIFEGSKERQDEILFRDNVSNGEWKWDVIMVQWDLQKVAAWGVKIPDFVTKKTRKKTQEDYFEPIRHPHISALGDVYELISDDCTHRLIVADSAKPNTMKTLCGDTKIDCVFTDPPYNVNYSGKGKKTSNTIHNDNMERGKFREFLTAVFKNYVAYAKPGCAYYVCHSSSSQRDFEDCMENAGLKVKNQLIWKKNVASMGWGDYRWMHEPLFYATVDKKDVAFYGDRKQYTVLEEELTPEIAMKIVQKMAHRDETGGGTVWNIDRESNYEHPTQKPLQLIEIALHNSTKEGDVICDLFSGSGSTLIACEQLGRVCYTAELDPKYADVTIARYIFWKRKAQERFAIRKNGMEIAGNEFDGIIG